MLPIWASIKKRKITASLAALAGACGHGNQGNNGYKEKRTNAQNLEKSMGSVKGKMNKHHLKYEKEKPRGNR